MPTLSSVGATAPSPGTGEVAGNFCARACQGRAVECGTVLQGPGAVAAVLAGRQAMGQSAVLAVREDW